MLTLVLLTLAGTTTSYHDTTKYYLCPSIRRFLIDRLLSGEIKGYKDMEGRYQGSLDACSFADSRTIA